jgi:prepilin-type N-terminal cleavage/methylation domain-containing protein
MVVVLPAGSNDTHFWRLRLISCLHVCAGVALFICHDHHRHFFRCRKGFSLVELSVVVIIIGVLAAFAMPRLLRMVEGSKAAEAFSYLASVRASQERYQAQHGTCADELTSLDMQLPIPKYFKIHEHSFHKGATGSFEDSWKLKLEREGPSAGFGDYHVTFTQDGYDPDDSSIENFPEIVPVSH